MNLTDPTTLMYIASDRHRSLIERAAADRLTREARQIARARRRTRRQRIRSVPLSTLSEPRPLASVPASSPSPAVDALVAVRNLEAISA